MSKLKFFFPLALSSFLAMKQYGLILADNGSSMYISGAPDDRWSNDDLHNLSQVHASDFDVIQISPLYTSSNVPSGSNPTISSFTASSTSISSSTQVTLSWQVSGASYVIVSPSIGQPAPRRCPSRPRRPPPTPSTPAMPTAAPPPPSPSPFTSACATLVWVGFPIAVEL
jgi:hypothetical protein